MPVNFLDPGGPGREERAASPLAFSRGSDGSDTPQILPDCIRDPEDPSNSLADIFLALWMTCGFRYHLPLTGRSNLSWGHSGLTVRLAPRGFLTPHPATGIVPVEELWHLSEGVRRQDVRVSHFMAKVQQHVSEWTVRPVEDSDGLSSVGPFHQVVATSFSRFMEADAQVGAPPIHPERKGSSSLAVLGQELPEGLGRNGSSLRSGRSRRTHGDGSSTKYCDVSHTFRQMKYTRANWNITEEQAARGFAAVEWVLLLFRPDDSRTLEVPLRGSSFGLNTTERGPCLFLCTEHNLHFEFQCPPHAICQAQWARVWASCGARPVPFSSFYRRIERIGAGSFAQVYLGQHVFTDERVVIKSIEKKRLQQANAFTEVQILRKVTHPAIVSIIAAFENDETLAIVMEYIRGGDLYELMRRLGPYSEDQARTAVRRLLHALVALHAREIIHRDLKTENIMLRDADDPTSVCVIDFGLAATLGSDLMTMRCGSPGYVAPEVLDDQRYGTKCDVFSAGVIFFTMLTGKPPFRGENAKEILGKNARCNIAFRGWPFTNISDEARHLLGWMTQRDPELRCSAMAALRHPWLCRERRLLPGGPTLDNSVAILYRLPRDLHSPAQRAFVMGFPPSSSLRRSQSTEPESMESAVSHRDSPSSESDKFFQVGGLPWPVPKTRLFGTNDHEVINAYDDDEEPSPPRRALPTKTRSRSARPWKRDAFNLSRLSFPRNAL